MLVWVRHDIRLENIITSELPWSRTRQPSRLVRQQLQTPGKRRVQRISVGVVKAEMVDEDLGFAVVRESLPSSARERVLQVTSKNRV